MYDEFVHENYAMLFELLRNTEYEIRILKNEILSDN